MGIGQEGGGLIETPFRSATCTVENVRGHRASAVAHGV